MMEFPDQIIVINDHNYHYQVRSYDLIIFKSTATFSYFLTRLSLVSELAKLNCLSIHLTQ